MGNKVEGSMEQDGEEALETGCLPAIRSGFSFFGFTVGSELMVTNSEGRDDLCIFPEVFRDIPLADERNLCDLLKFFLFFSIIFCRLS